MSVSATLRLCIDLYYLVSNMRGADERFLALQVHLQILRDLQNDDWSLRSAEDGTIDKYQMHLSYSGADTNRCRLKEKQKSCEAILPVLSSWQPQS
jgi:hypothetical protein